LYGSQDRAFRFWEQAKLAEVRGTPDAVEAFYLCVMLGFRGELGGRPERLRAWVEPTQARLSRTGAQELSLPPEREFRPNVPPRHGRDQLQVMVMAWAGVILLLLPLLVFYITFFVLLKN
jgi:type VI secretion system protein ImpK